MTRRALGLLNAMTEQRHGALADQLVEVMREMILDGIFEPGERLPGSRMLARDARVSRSTVLAAIEALTSEGLLESRSRSGTYVAWQGKRNAGHAGPRARAPHDGELVPFASCTPAIDLFPLNVWRRLQSRRWWSMPRSALHEYQRAGVAELREAIATNLRISRGIKCDADEVFVTTGAEMAILLAATAARAEGALAWTEDPIFSRPCAALRAAGVTPIPVPLDDSGISVRAGQQIAPDARLALVMPSSQFPSTVTMTAERKHELLDWTIAHDSLIIEDDYDSEYLPGDAPRPIAALARGREHVIYVNTFGRTLFPSLRLGYLVAPPKLVDGLHEARKMVGGDTTTPNQLVLCDFLTGGHFARHMRLCREAFALRRKTLIEELTRTAAAPLNLTNPAPTSHLCLNLPHEVDDAALAQRAADIGIHVKPLSRFVVGQNKSRGLILGFGPHPPEALVAAVARFAPLLNEALDRAPKPKVA
jgi:GntR family transcriptional regulator/MocR family aminotransferase